MSESLKNCPFCGGKTGDNGPLTFDCQEGATDHQIYCWGCGAQSKLFATEPEAIAAWNRRTTIASPGEAEGWALVPIEPTNAMISAAIEAWESKDFPGPEAEFSAVYRAMVAARPFPADVGGGS